MKMIFKCYAKKLFGAKYERALRNLFVIFILYWGLHQAEISITIAPSILYFMISFLTAGVMWQSCPDAEYDDASSGREKICFCLYRSPWLVYDFYQNRCFTGSDSGSVRTGMAGNHTHDFLYDKRSTGDCSHLFS